MVASCFAPPQKSNLLLHGFIMSHCYALIVEPAFILMVNGNFVGKEGTTPCAYYDPSFPTKKAKEYYLDLRRNIHWEKTVKIKRWVSLFHRLCHFPASHKSVLHPQMLTAKPFKNLMVERKVTISSLDELVSNETFRVSCDRIGGPLAFTHPQVAAEMGGVTSEYYEPRINPKMGDYDVHVRADIVVGNVVVVGTQLNVLGMSKERHFLHFRNEVTIKTNLAYAMVRLET